MRPRMGVAIVSWCSPTAGFVNDGIRMLCALRQFSSRLSAVNKQSVTEQGAPSAKRWPNVFLQRDSSLTSSKRAVSARKMTG
jgi:hypothetical protein